MIRKSIPFIGLFLLFSLAGFAKNSTQENQPEINNPPDSNLVIHGLVLDSKSKSPLPYTHIYVLAKHTGAVSNENGEYAIEISKLEPGDTLRFQYMGYKTVKHTVEHLQASPDVLMEENIFNLSQILVFGSNPNPREIVKKVLEKKDRNYIRTTSRQKVFVRERDVQDMNEFRLKYKKSSVPQLDRYMIDLVEEKFPDNFTSFTDFLGDLYFNKNMKDSVTFKIEPDRTVSLKEKDMADLEELEKIFENVFANTNSNEYWKMRTGIFGGKLDMEDESDTLQADTLNVKPEKDTLAENERRIKHYRWGLLHKQKFPRMDDKNEWEFLYKTGRYKYTLAGGTHVNGEEVYIIDFEPRIDGLYHGRMFIAMHTYALIRADYEYAPGKVGLEVQLLGIGYTEAMFGGSVYFEKQDSTYALKYFSYKSASKASINRKFALIKKRKRFLFDKTLMEVKARLTMAMTMNESVEYLVLESEQISDEEFTGFQEKEKMDIILVDQFDDRLWDGYTIIEPVKQMREYKKQKVSFMEQ